MTKRARGTTGEDCTPPSKSRPPAPNPELDLEELLQVPPDDLPVLCGTCIHAWSAHAAVQHAWTVRAFGSLRTHALGSTSLVHGCKAPADAAVRLNAARVAIQRQTKKGAQFEGCKVQACGLFMLDDAESYASWLAVSKEVAPSPALALAHPAPRARNDSGAASTGSEGTLLHKADEEAATPTATAAAGTIETSAAAGTACRTPQEDAEAIRIVGASAAAAVDSVVSSTERVDERTRALQTAIITAAAVAVRLETAKAQALGASAEASAASARLEAVAVATAAAAGSLSRATAAAMQQLQDTLQRQHMQSLQAQHAALLQQHQRALLQALEQRCLRWCCLRPPQFPRCP